MKRLTRLLLMGIASVVSVSQAALGGTATNKSWNLVFILATDPGEQSNLAATQPDLAQRLRAKLHAWQDRVGAQHPSVNQQWKRKK